MLSTKITYLLTPTVFTLALVASGCAYSADITDSLPKSVQSGASKQGAILTDTNAMTLYTFDKDQPNQSNCYKVCAEKWPPLLTANAVSNSSFSTSERKDGQLQLNYQGKPLYLWVGDSKPGDISGDGIKGVWHLIKI